MNWQKRITQGIGSQGSIVLHTVFFAIMLSLPFFGVGVNTALLILTTVVSLEAIYLALFIQMTVNENTESLLEVEEDIEEIQQDVDEIQQDVDEISTEIEEIESDIDEIQVDVKEERVEGEEDFDKVMVLLEKLISEVDRLKKGK